MLQTITSNALVYAIAFAIGGGLGLARGGSFAAVRHARIEAWPVLAVGLVLQLAAESGAPGAVSLAIIGTFLLILGLGLNLHLRGTTITNIGLMLNITVLTLNGHMPVRVNALKETGLLDPSVNEATATITLSGFSAVETSATTLPWLGDVLGRSPLLAPMSFGDLAILAGLSIVLQNLMLAKRTAGVSVDELFGAEHPTVENVHIHDGHINDGNIDDGEIIDLRTPATDPARTPVPEPGRGAPAPTPSPTPGRNGRNDRDGDLVPDFQPWADPVPVGVPAGVRFPTHRAAMQRLSPLPFEEGDVRLVALRSQESSGRMPSPAHV